MRQSPTSPEVQAELRDLSNTLGLQAPSDDQDWAAANTDSRRVVQFAACALSHHPKQYWTRYALANLVFHSFNAAPKEERATSDDVEAFHRLLREHSDEAVIQSLTLQWATMKEQPPLTVWLSQQMPPMT